MNPQNGMTGKRLALAAMGGTAIGSAVVAASASLFPVMPFWGFMRACLLKQFTRGGAAHGHRFGERQRNPGEWPQRPG